MQFLETQQFTSRAAELLVEEELRRMKAALASYPEIGVAHPGHPMLRILEIRENLFVCYVVAAEVDTIFLLSIEDGSSIKMENGEQSVLLRLLKTVGKLIASAVLGAEIKEL